MGLQIMETKVKLSLFSDRRLYLSRAYTLNWAEKRGGRHLNRWSTIAKYK